MAKAAVNKSAAIRAYYASHPGAKPKEVVAGLAEKGVAVNTQTVSTVRYNMRLKKKSRGARRGRPPATETVTPARRAAGNGHQRGATLFTALVDAKKLSDRLGGIDRAKQALKMLEQLI